ncbi:MAG: biosynthetic peptidoglycan transglycosylase [Myxococcales bacterium]|nr:biosynthetic peptidoglycan transglycosylase [Myxococcales bacterium]
MQRWKERVHRAVQKLSTVLAEGSFVEVGQFRATVHRGADSLHVGPGVLSMQSGAKAVNVGLTPVQGGEGSTPLLISAELPVLAEEGLTLRIRGGPVTLGMLGVQEGDLGLLDVGKASVEAGGEIRLSGDATRVDVDLKGVARGLSIQHQKLATEPVKGLDLRFVWVGGVALDGSSLRIDRGEFGVGKVQAEVSGSWERQGDEHTLRGKFAIPLASCQAALDGLPAGLAPVLVGMKMAGTFSVSSRVVFESKHPEKAEVDVQFLHDCRVTAVPPLVDVARFRQPFRRQVYDPNGKLVEVETGPGTPGWVSWGGITPLMEAAVLTTEDGGFRKHRGFDLEAIRASIRENLKSGKFLRGASTISMQTAKNLYLYRDKTVGRKLQEAFLTMYLEQALSKEQILELYLNSIEFGPMIYGIGPAAQYYFKTSAAELSLGQALYLASILPNPKRQYFGADGRVYPRFMGYLRRLMRGMAKRNLIREDELEEGLSEWVVFGQPPSKSKEKLPDALEDTNEGAVVPDAPLFLIFCSQSCEEGAEGGSTSSPLDSSVDLDPVRETWVVQDCEAATDSTGLGVIGTVNEPRNACIEQSASAHQARFKGADEGASVETPGASEARTLPEDEDLGVGCGILVEFASVVGGGEEGSLGGEEEGPHGDIAGRRCEGSDGERLMHPRRPGGQCGAARARSHGICLPHASPCD